MLDTKESRDRPDEKIAVTPEMILAGVTAFDWCRDAFTTDELVSAVYIAMARQSRLAREEKCEIPEGQIAH